jgi:hypothetical protein
MYKYAMEALFYLRMLRARCADGDVDADNVLHADLDHYCRDMHVFRSGNFMESGFLRAAKMARELYENAELRAIYIGDVRDESLEKQTKQTKQTKQKRSTLKSSAVRPPWR